MTTIASDGRSIAADSRTTCGGEIVSSTTDKIQFLSDGSLVAGSGVSTNIIRAIRELERQLSGPCDNPSLLEGDYTLLRLTPEGEAIVYYSELTPIYVDLPCAIGSGGEYAVGAMLAGASPERAVRIACQVDTGSGGHIQVARPNRRKSIK